MSPHKLHAPWLALLWLNFSAELTEHKKLWTRTVIAGPTWRAFEEERPPLAQSQGGGAQVAAPGRRLDQARAGRAAGLQAYRAGPCWQQDAGNGCESLRRWQHACWAQNSSW